MVYSSGSIDPNPESATWLGIVYAVYAAIGIPANLLVLIVTLTNENVRAVPLNICIFSLAFADMMVLVSCLSSIFWAITFDIRVCKIMGVGMYVFVDMSLILPCCLAVCRHYSIRNEQESHPYLNAIRTRKGILILNGMFWIYGITFTIPFNALDKFGLDAMGCCGVAVIDSIFLWVYYMVLMVGVLFGAYIVTFIFYQKLGKWVQHTSSMLMMSEQTRETLKVTHSLMRMMKWLLFFPVVAYYPALTVQAILRIFPDIVSLHTARIFMITVPLPHIVDPIVTIICVKRYRTAVSSLLRGKGNDSRVHPSAHPTGRIQVALE